MLHTDPLPTELAKVHILHWKIYYPILKKHVHYSFIVWFQDNCFADSAMIRKILKHKTLCELDNNIGEGYYTLDSAKLIEGSRRTNIVLHGGTRWNWWENTESKRNILEKYFSIKYSDQNYNDSGIQTKVRRSMLM